MQDFNPQKGQTMDSHKAFVFGGTDKLGSLSVTVYMVGLALGILLFAPLSDVYGRLWITRVNAFCYTICSIACALSPSLAALVGFRVSAGFFGGAAQVIGGSVVADLYETGKRDTAMAFYTAAPVLGPVLGSIVGSLINSALGWRWVFWFASILVRHRSSVRKVL
jgi:MFS family permease